MTLIPSERRFGALIASNPSRSEVSPGKSGGVTVCACNPKVPMSRKKIVDLINLDMLRRLWDNDRIVWLKLNVGAKVAAFEHFFVIKRKAYTRSIGIRSEYVNLS